MSVGVDTLFGLRINKENQEQVKLFKGKNWVMCSNKNKKCKKKNIYSVVAYAFLPTREAFSFQK